VSQASRKARLAKIRQLYVGIALAVGTVSGRFWSRDVAIVTSRDRTLNKVNVGTECKDFASGFGLSAEATGRMSRPF